MQCANISMKSKAENAIANALKSGNGLPRVRSAVTPRKKKTLSVRVCAVGSAECVLKEGRPYFIQVTPRVTCVCRDKVYS